VKKILVVDDDAIVRETLVEILSSEGYDLVTAQDGRHGLKLFRSENPDLVVTDIIMPEMEGIQMITEIRAMDPKAKVIAVSGGARIGNTDFLKIARLLGANDVVYKPFDPDDFLARVSKCLAS
jgi:CheY-like chemotaxis protein